MKRLLVVLGVVLLALVALGAGDRAKAVMIGDEQVTPVRRLTSRPLFEIKGLRFADAKRDRNDEPCSIVGGDFVSHLPSRDYVVTVRIEFFDKHTRRGSFHNKGSAEAVFERPVPGVPVPFVAAGPDLIANRWVDTLPNTFTGYTVTYRFDTFRPKREWQAPQD